MQDRVSRSSGVSSAAGSRDGGSESGGFDMLTAAEWPGVPPAAVLLSPGQCRGLWRQFLSDSNFIVQQACSPKSSSPSPSGTRLGGSSGLEVALL